LFLLLAFFPLSSGRKNLNSNLKEAKEQAKEREPSSEISMPDFIPKQFL